MSKVEMILKEINSLHPGQIQTILRELLKTISKKEELLKFLSEYKGIGKGVWKEDAQAFVTHGRNDKRN
jgi:hypothetical protein